MIATGNIRVWSRPGLAGRPAHGSRTDAPRGDPVLVTLRQSPDGTGTRSGYCWSGAAVGPTVGVLRLPSGRLVRGRGLKQGAGEGAPPEFGLYLQSKPPPPVDWSSRWLLWPDWWLPVNRDDARNALLELWRRAEAGRVEVACTGGRGRTGAALACLAVLDGVPAGGAVNYVRRHYHPQAVETPWQQHYVRRFQP